MADVIISVSGNNIFMVIMIMMMMIMVVIMIVLMIVIMTVIIMIAIMVVIIMIVIMNISIMNTTAIDIRCHNGTVFASNHCENFIAQLFKYL